MRRWLTVGPGLVVVGLLGWWVLPADRPARVVTVASAAAVPELPPVELVPVEPPPPVVTTPTTTEPVPEPTTTTTTAPPAPRVAPPKPAPAPAMVSVQAAPATTTTTIAVNEIWVGTGSQGVSGHLGVGQPIWVRDAPGHCFQTDRESAPYVTPDPTCP